MKNRVKKENKYLIYDKPMEKNMKYYIKRIYITISNFFYRMILFLLAKPKFIKKKYYVTICAIFKNEGKYIREWIEYHKLIGVEHFYMYNNNSTDNYQEILKPYIESGLVTLKQWPFERKQLEAYTDCINNFKKESNWIGFIDLDEFIVPIENNYIYEFLNKYERYPAVKIYWKLFGTSGIINRNMENLVIEDFCICWNKYYEVGKCFYNTTYDFDYNYKYNQIFHHNFWGKWKHINFPPVNSFGNLCQKGFDKVDNFNFSIQINHYFTKSYEEYIEKASKGDVYFENNPHNMDYFYKHECLCTDYDVKIYKYLIKLKRIMNIIS